MSESAASFVGDIPEEYDRGLGPIIFADFAIDMARRVAAAGPMRVLETAAGTGIVTRLLRDLLPAEAHLTATDLNAPMLAIASGKFRPEERVKFRTACAGSGVPNTEVPATKVSAPAVHASAMVSTVMPPSTSRTARAPC